MNDPRPMLALEIEPDVAQIWQRLYAVEQRPLEEFIKDVIVREALKYDAFQITENVRALLGIAPTTADYRTLRDQMVTERIADYENLSCCQSQHERP